jgi:hypothetical protein
MSKLHRISYFAAVQTLSGRFWVDSHTVRLRAYDARIVCGENWREQGDTSWREGWARARRYGFRIHKIEVRLAL